MEVSYKRNRGFSYLILTEDPQTAGQHYQKAIFLENTIPGLLPCKIQRLNGEESFCYDITGCQSLKNLFEKEKLSRKDLEDILQSWLNLWEILGEYLLDTDFLLLDPAYLYRETQTGNYRFVWFPYRLREKGSAFQALTEYFLPRIDHKDKGAVALGYGVYKEAAGENLHPAVIKNLLWESKPQEKSENIYLQKDSSDFSQVEDPEKEAEKKERQRILDEFYSEEEENPVSYGIFGGIGGIFLVCILVFLFWHFRLFSPFHLFFFLIIFLFLSGLGILLYIFLVRKKKKTSLVASSKNLPAHGSDDFSLKSHTPEPVSSDPGQWKKEENRVSESLTAVLKEAELSAPFLSGLGTNAGKIFSLEKEQTLIGKWAASADICLDAPTVSRIHARILREGDNCYAVDLNSKNGTLINGIPLDPEEKNLLQDSDIICFAKEEFRYSSPHSRPLNDLPEN